MLRKHIVIFITTIMLIAGITTGCDMFSGKSNAQKSLDKLKAKLVKEEKEKAAEEEKNTVSNEVKPQEQEPEQEPDPETEQEPEKK